MSREAEPLTPVAETPRSRTLSRREAVARVGSLLGASGFVGGHALLAACATQDLPPLSAVAAGYTPTGEFSSADVAFLDAAADTILPATSTPGAKAAAVGPFIALMVTDVYSPAERSVFRAGMREIESACDAAYGRAFLEATAGERTALLERFDAAQFDYMRSRRSGQSVHPFRMLKELTLLGYFTSEIGCTVAQRYIESPGRFDPCVPYRPGDSNWADHA